MPPDREHPQAVLFDVWYTLVYLEPDQEVAYVAALEEAASDLLEHWPAVPGAPALPDRPRLRRIFRQEFERAATLSRRGTSWPPGRQIWAVAERLGRRPRPSEFVERIGRIVARLPLQAAPGAAQVLADIRRAGYRVGIVSNTVGEPGRAMRKVMERHGLAAPVQAWAWSDEHPWTKPAPELFHWCLRKLGVPPDRAVHIGDGWSDVVGARWAGLRGSIQFVGHAHYSAAYKRSFAPPVPRWAAPTRVVRSFERVPGIVGELLDAKPPARSRRRSHR